MKDFIIKGCFLDSESPEKLRIVEAGYLPVVGGICRGIFPVIPEQFQPLPVSDCGDKLILPGMSDLHVHAPQFAFRGLGMDMELLDWLNSYTFPEEAKYSDPAYAEKGTVRASKLCGQGEYGSELPRHSAGAGRGNRSA